MSKKVIWLFSVSVALFGIFYWVARPISLPLKLTGEHTEKFRVYMNGRYEIGIGAKDENIEQRCFERFQTRGFDEYNLEASEHPVFSYQLFKNGKLVEGDNKPRTNRVTEQYDFSFGKFMLEPAVYEIKYQPPYIPCIKDMNNLRLEMIYKEIHGTLPLWIVIGERLSFLVALGCLLWVLFSFLKTKMVQLLNGIRSKV